MVHGARPGHGLFEQYWEVIRPSMQEGIHAGEQVQLWDLRQRTQLFHFGFELSLFLRGNAQSEPAGSIPVPLTAQIIAQKAIALAPVGDVGLFRVLGESQVLLEPRRHGLFEVLCFRLGVLAQHD